ncbi:MAG: hypothetical protein BGO12_03565 [Verrucomicrobia bacterium 61-8]|nr:helix-turn-helix transcriptional regulator [Verrucomicrobiota bacterium]OJU99287.1 MAG: hypothetical protein BGO12_03565 [Verrucomicrobia bacterium 61-8]
MTFLYRGVHTLHPENAGLFVSPGFGCHPQRVIPTYEIIFVRSGTLLIADEHQSFVVSGGQTLILWPKISHRGTGGYESDLSFYWLHFRLQADRRKSDSCEPIAQQATPKRPERLTELFHRYLDDQESGRLSAEQARLLAGLMLLEIHSPEIKTSPSEENLAGRAQRHIATHFATGLHAGAVAAAIGCHPDYLGRVYRKVFGQTLSEAIHKNQIAEARRLLRESDQNIDEIASASGFREPRYFRKLFRESQGMSPRAYRSLYSRSHINVR